MESNLSGQADESQLEAIHNIERLLLGNKEPIEANRNEPQETSDSEEEAVEEQSDEDGQVDTDQEEDEGAKDEPKYKIKVGGEEKEVPVSELINGYQRQSDYTKKTMELADQRKAMEAEAAKINELAQVRQQYYERLDLLETLLGQGRSEQEFLQINEEQGAQAYIRAKIEEEQRLGQLQKLRNEKERLRMEAESQYKTAIQRARHEALEQLPELKSKENYEKLASFVVENGFSRDDLDVTADPRVLKLALMAMKAAEFEKARESVKEKKVVSANPKMQKPAGRVSESHIRAEQHQKKQAQLRKTGSLEDAAALFADLL